MKTNWVILFVSGCLIACGGTQDTSLVAGSDGDLRIIGGAKVDKRDPLALGTAAIYLMNKNNEEAYCSGTLIAPTLILTAAHCFDKSAQVPKHVIFFANGKKQVSVRSYHVIPTRATQRGQIDGHDVAVIELKDIAPQSTRVVPLVAVENEARKVGELLFVAGVGRNRASGKMSEREKKEFKMGDFGEGTLRKATVAFGGLVPTTKAWTSAGPCVGDSGGPAYVQTEAGLELYGVMTSVDDSNFCNAKTYLTLISAHRAWIEQMIDWANAQLEARLAKKKK